MMLGDATSHPIALTVVLLLAGGLLLLAVRAYRRTRYTPAQAPFYLISFLLTRILWRARVTGPLPIAADRPAVIVCNHRSGVDPFFIALTAPRPVHWMVAREYCEHLLYGWLLRILQVIPVGRGGVDTAATRLAIRHCQSGELVGIFPEGRINKTDQLLLPGRPGAALVALKAQVPVVPCYIAGSPHDGTTLGCFFMTARVRLVVGQPIDLSAYYGREQQREVLDEVTLLLLRSIAHLAGDCSFVPTLAGKHWLAANPAAAGTAASSSATDCPAASPEANLVATAPPLSASTAVDQAATPT